MDQLSLSFRNTVTEDDKEIVKQIVESTGFFYNDEVDIAISLVEEHLQKGDIASGYYFIFASSGNKVTGYTCFGPIPGSTGRFDLYWIAVDKNHQREGIGFKLINETERCIINLNGNRVYIETSSREIYAKTQKFYTKCGYNLIATLDKYYSLTDSKLIYMKELYT